MKPVGRFAPSPTGPLHMGSLLTALASYLHIKSRGGRWLIRIDDIDPVRAVPGATHAILSTLAGHGLISDAAPILQSRRTGAYEAALTHLQSQGQTFSCRCSRKQLDGQAIYPGHCRTLGLPPEGNAVRLRMPDRLIGFSDALQGPCEQHVARVCGDIVLRRRDGHYAYHLACAIDDGAGDVNEVLRGADLLEETPAQIALMKLLDLRVPHYAHLPVLRAPSGEKLSKQTGAAPVDTREPGDNLVFCMQLLGVSLPPDAINWPVSQLLDRGVSAFQLSRIPKTFPVVESTGIEGS